MNYIELWWSCGFYFFCQIERFHSNMWMPNKSRYTSCLYSILHRIHGNQMCSMTAVAYSNKWGQESIHPSPFWNWRTHQVTISVGIPPYPHGNHGLLEIPIILFQLHYQTNHVCPKNPEIHKMCFSIPSRGFLIGKQTIMKKHNQALADWKCQVSPLHSASDHFRGRQNSEKPPRTIAGIAVAHLVDGDSTSISNVIGETIPRTHASNPYIYIYIHMHVCELQNA